MNTYGKRQWEKYQRVEIQTTKEYFLMGKAKNPGGEPELIAAERHGWL